jgi:hypothetical protein
VRSDGVVMTLNGRGTTVSVGNVIPSEFGVAFDQFFSSSAWAFENYKQKWVLLIDKF